VIIALLYRLSDSVYVPLYTSVTAILKIICVIEDISEELVTTHIKRWLNLVENINTE